MPSSPSPSSNLVHFLASYFWTSGPTTLPQWNPHFSFHRHHRNQYVFLSTPIKRYFSLFLFKALCVYSLGCNFRLVCRCFPELKHLPHFFPKFSFFFMMRPLCTVGFLMDVIFSSFKVMLKESLDSIIFSSS